ncbi:hypothetical protein QUF31_03820 [Dickeya chrysanthemi]|uniref:hypothetical protein n=1 Tax=Dickeya chrysanthemi TaxID=556 RepID=UPI0025A2C389|nr:hypothetical protein [Dickeya chrysanthemi]WJM86257.1 hypothetical protein QUF31_03820 [Dickeya chrysanthemi]
MLYTIQHKQHIYFIGQNSHGSDESWLFRNDFINKELTNTLGLILVECPTIDLIVFALRKFRKTKQGEMSYLKSSSYWWMRSMEFATFLHTLPEKACIAGIDLPLSTTQHKDYISSIRAVSLPEKNLLLELLNFDFRNMLCMASATPEQREVSMAEKIEIAVRLGFESIIIICHNFHATRTSWLHYPSLCQIVARRLSKIVKITTYGLFSVKMAFIATPDGRSLTVNTVNHACERLDNQTYKVKMISSHYKTEAHDAMELILHTPQHFDEFVIFPEGKSLTMGLC